MAGSNQHFIPKFLQRGFLSRKTKKRGYTFEYCKDYAPKERRIDTLGTKTHFYSKPSVDGAPTLDDKITEYENSLAIRVNEWRELEPGTLIDSAQASEMVTHLSMRTQSLRATFWTGLTNLMHSLRDKMSDRDGIADLFGLENNEPESLLISGIRKSVATSPEFMVLRATLDIDASVFERVMLFLFREYFGTFSTSILEHVRREVLPYLDAIPNAIGKGHNDALSQIMDNATSLSRFKDLTWSVEGPEKDEFILPDCVSVSVGESGRFAPFVVSDDRVQSAVLLPISYKRILVGRRKGERLVNLSCFNEEAAACCTSFFIARAACKELEALREQIGMRSQAFIDKLSLDALTQKSPSEEKDVEIVAPHEFPESLELTLFDWGNEADAKELLRRTQPVISVFGSLMNISRLEGLTIAYDYGRALQELDRGNPELRPSTTVPEDAGFGLAQSPLIIRKGEVQFRTILRYDIAHALLGDDEAKASYALHILANQFAYVDAVTAIDETFPGVLLQPIQGFLTSALFNFSYPAITTYLAYRSSFGFGVDEAIKSDHEAVVQRALKLYAEELPRRINSYQNHLDVDRLLAEAVEIAGYVLTSMAQFIGYLDGLNEDFSNHPGIQEKLEDQSLREWAQRYALELRRLWKTHGKWPSFEVFTDVNVHIERLLWRYGLFMWPEGQGGQVRVMPPGFDFNSMLRQIPERLTQKVANPDDLQMMNNLRKANNDDL